jgi:hypothetical protein
MVSVPDGKEMVMDSSFSALRHRGVTGRAPAFRD